MNNKPSFRTAKITNRGALVICPGCGADRLPKSRFCIRCGSHRAVSPRRGWVRRRVVPAVPAVVGVVLGVPIAGYLLLLLLMLIFGPALDALVAYLEGIAGAMAMATPES